MLAAPPPRAAEAESGLCASVSVCSLGSRSSTCLSDATTGHCARTSAAAPRTCHLRNGEQRSPARLAPPFLLRPHLEHASVVQLVAGQVQLNQAGHVLRACARAAAEQRQRVYVSPGARRHSHAGAAPPASGAAVQLCARQGRIPRTASPRRPPHPSAPAAVQPASPTAPASRTESAAHLHVLKVGGAGQLVPLEQQRLQRRECLQALHPVHLVVAARTQHAAWHSAAPQGGPLRARVVAAVCACCGSVAPRGTGGPLLARVAGVLVASCGNVPRARRVAAGHRRARAHLRSSTCSCARPCRPCMDRRRLLLR